MNRPARSVVVLLLLGGAGCSLLHHGRNKLPGCKEPQVGFDSQNRAPLKVPAGLDAPDTRNAIKIPPLTEPERPRTPQEPCLTLPPRYKS